MRKSGLLFLALATACAGYAQQVPTEPGPAIIPTPTPINGIPNEGGFYDRSKLYFWDEFYLIDGKKVMGTPFLYHDWEKGIITTADGRLFNGYRLKYDAYNQAVHFHNGTDSLEVDEKIKEFSLFVTEGKEMKQYHFVNSDQYAKQKKVSYYEVVWENPSAQFLKYNYKIIAVGDKTLPVAEGRKIFELRSEFYFYNKKTQKISRIKANGANMAEILGIDNAKAEELKLNQKDFSTEQGILDFLKEYFDQSKA
jgi:hypothetical protein